MVLNKLKKWTFWILSRAAMSVYPRLPIFGRLKAAVGVIQEGDKFLVIERNDGRGVSFPGGLGWPWETAEQTMAREILEETGLTVRSFLLVLRYDTSVGIPVDLAVFEVKADGQLRGSWEGTPAWLDLAELRSRVVRSQERIVRRLGEGEEISRR
jgi:8-oxo-dGTP pyrophosphatase MutT (NUDIX family)